MCIECFEKLPRFYYKEREYITWQDDEVCRVGFSEIPDIGNKEINVKVMSKAQIKAAKKKPLFLKNTVDICLIDKIKNKTYTFTIKMYYIMLIMTGISRIEFLSGYLKLEMLAHFADG